MLIDGISETVHRIEKMFLEYISKTDLQKALQLTEYFLRLNCIFKLDCIIIKLCQLNQRLK